MTLTQCQLKFAELISNIDTYIHQASGTTSENASGVTEYGFEDLVKSRIGARSSAWNSITIYNVGDLVTFNGSPYISLRNFNLDKNPGAEDFYWSRKEEPASTEDISVKVWGKISGGSLVASEGVDHITILSPYIYVYYTTPFSVNKVKAHMSSAKGDTKDIFRNCIYGTDGNNVSYAKFELQYNFSSTVYDNNDIFFHVEGFR